MVAPADRDAAAGAGGPVLAPSALALAFARAGTGIHLRSISLSRLTSSGFARKSFIPDSKQRSTSTFITLAVMAMMGRWVVVPASLARMVLVSSKPSRLGMWQSVNKRA